MAGICTYGTCKHGIFNDEKTLSFGKIRRNAERDRFFADLQKRQSEYEHESWAAEWLANTAFDLSEIEIVNYCRIHHCVCMCVYACLAALLWPADIWLPCFSRLNC
jgi:hypothetical protein